jgi:hypothetical protein
VHKARLFAAHSPRNPFDCIDAIERTAKELTSECLEHAVEVHVAQRVLVALDEAAQVLDALGLVEWQLLSVWLVEVAAVDGVKDASLECVQVIEMALVVAIEVHHVVVAARREVDAIVEHQRGIVASVNGRPVIQLWNFAEAIRQSLEVVASKQLANLIDVELAPTVLVKAELVAAQICIIIHVPIIVIRIEANV